MLPFFIGWTRSFELFLNLWYRCCLLFFLAVLLIGGDYWLFQGEFFVWMLMQTFHEVVHDIYVGQLGLLLVSLLFDKCALFIRLACLLLLRCFWLWSLGLGLSCGTSCCIGLLLFFVGVFIIFLRWLLILSFFFGASGSRLGLIVACRCFNFYMLSNKLWLMNCRLIRFFFNLELLWKFKIVSEVFTLWNFQLKCLGIAFILLLIRKLSDIRILYIHLKRGIRSHTPAYFGNQVIR